MSIRSINSKGVCSNRGKNCAVREIFTIELNCATDCIYHESGCIFASVLHVNLCTNSKINYFAISVFANYSYAVIADIADCDALGYALAVKCSCAIIKINNARCNSSVKDRIIGFNNKIVCIGVFTVRQNKLIVANLFNNGVGLNRLSVKRCCSDKF